jgi:protein-disulfide isomerase
LSIAPASGEKAANRNLDAIMLITRRTLFAASTLLVPSLARAQAASDPRMAPRADGPATAPVKVEEWFSFTCPHCAEFAAETFPDIKAKLCDTGKIYYEFKEFPRDRVDLTAAMVARSLPPSRYEPFVMSLLATQQQWAFNRDADPREELAKMAGLAGMPRAQFDKVVDDEQLQSEILEAQSKAEQKYNIDSTPTFIVNGHSHPGGMSYEQFARLVGA